jgi:hypothetical protein
MTTIGLALLLLCANASAVLFGMSSNGDPSSPTTAFVSVDAETGEPTAEFVFPDFALSNCMAMLPDHDLVATCTMNYTTSNFCIQFSPTQRRVLPPPPWCSKDLSIGNLAYDATLGLFFTAFESTGGHFGIYSLNLTSDIEPRLRFTFPSVPWMAIQPGLSAYAPSTHSLYLIGVMTHTHQNQLLTVDLHALSLINNASLGNGQPDVMLTDASTGALYVWTKTDDAFAALGTLDPANGDFTPIVTVLPNRYQAVTSTASVDSDGHSVVYTALMGVADPDPLWHTTHLGVSVHTSQIAVNASLPFPLLEGVVVALN